MSNPFLERIAKSSRVAHGGLSEARVASQLGARLQPSSGAMKGAKSDSISGSYRIESKSSIKATIPLEKIWLDKITTEALNHGQVPMVTVSFVDATGKKQDLNADWVILPMWKFKELKQLEEDHGDSGQG